jgi:hypothetical protein
MLVVEVLALLGTGAGCLSAVEAALRLEAFGV